MTKICILFMSLDYKYTFHKTRKSVLFTRLEKVYFSQD